MLRPKNITQKQPVEALPLQRCLAKTYLSPQGDKLPGRNIFDHACIVGAVAKVLASLYPSNMCEIFFPDGYAYAASVHDVGKISPSFQKRLYAATGSIPAELEPVQDPALETLWGGHAGAGQITLEACGAGKHLPGIVGRHHGHPLQQQSRISTDSALGGKAWHDRRLELLDALKAHFREPWPQITSQERADVLTGLTTVADWIGSGSLFDDPRTNWRENIDQAVYSAGFIRPTVLSGLSFQTIFGYSPYPVQEQFYNACTGPGVYMLEAPMGLGKTEAALYAAYRLINEGSATGIYFALPTRLTSDTIHSRVEPFLRKILAPDSTHTHALLLHGKAQLRKMEMGEEGAPGGEWFTSLKRAILAPFGVGTLDQALLAVLPDCRHNFIRSFGLLGKVVILDEIHSYDSYTGLLLDSLIRLLRALHCTVMLLSATLTRKHRTTLLGGNAVCEAYPLISATTLGETCLREIPVSPPPTREVTIRACDTEQAAFGEAIERAEQGQQVLWIENTVAEAQDCYKKLAALASGVVECGLLHSRFLPEDRARLEARWIGYYGKDANERGRCGRILVGTQVLEQSLDIDADFLVTSLCPVDMFLQRLGRLWRHTLPNRVQEARCEAWLLTPPQSGLLRLEDFRKSARVYYPYVLFRSLEVLRPLQSIRLPDGIRLLLEDAYAEREENGLPDEWKRTMQQEVEQLSRHARVAQSALGQARSERIATRYSEIDSTPVLLLRKMETNRDGMRLYFIGGGEKFFPRNIKAYDKAAWRRLAVVLDSNMLSVASYHAPQSKITKQESEYFKNFIWLGEDGDSALRIALVTESGELRAMGGRPASDRYNIEYAAHLGYVVNKK